MQRAAESDYTLGIWEDKAESKAEEVKESEDITVSLLPTLILSAAPVALSLSASSAPFLPDGCRNTGRSLMLLIDFSPHFTLQVHTAWFNCCEIPRRQASSQFDCIRVPPWGLVKKCPDPFHSHLCDIEDYFGVCLNPLTRWNRTWGGLTPVHMCVLLCSPAVVVVRGAGPTPPAPSPEEQAERAAGKSPHAARPEQHEARSHTQVSGARAPFRPAQSHCRKLLLSSKIGVKMKRDVTCQKSFLCFEERLGKKVESQVIRTLCAQDSPTLKLAKSSVYIFWGSWGNVMPLWGNIEHVIHSKN